MKTIFVFTATPYEAAPIINLTDNFSEKIVGNIIIKSFNLNGCNINVIITGIGEENVKYTISTLENEINSGCIVNIGIAGAVSKEFNIGDFFSVNKILFKNKCLKIKCFDNLPQTTINTVDFKNKTNNISGKLIDMESFFIADFACKKNMDCYIIKMISDFADEQTAQLSKIKKLMKQYYFPIVEDIFNKLVKELNKNEK